MNQIAPYTNTVIDLLIVVVLIVGIRQFRAPRGARRGNFTAAFALGCAFFLVLFRNGIIDIFTVVISLFAGSVLGYAVARRVNMIQIPAMVAFQNGAGGVAAFIVSLLELTRGGVQMPLINQVSGVLGLCIGSLTFSGSMVASAKLANKMRQTPQILNKHSFLVLVNVLALVIVGLAALFAPEGVRAPLFILQILLGLVFGVLFSIRIGGADMPVLISLLNATTGLAAALCGMVIANQLLIAAGATVLASGSILTYVMCKAMNRNLGSILIPSAKAPSAPKEQPAETQGAFMPQGGLENPEPEEKKEKEGADDLSRAANVLANAREVIIVPGYGMALAQAQEEVVAMAGHMTELGKKVSYAIHPVAGRMPGHMNVLLAEAGVEYEMLMEMDDVNPLFASTDAVLVVGACDVVNPAAIDAEGTPISGMPILHAHEAANIVCCNFDEKPGYSGVENPLYRNEKTIMLPGDAKNSIRQIMDKWTQKEDTEAAETAETADETPEAEAESSADKLLKACEVLEKAEKVIIVPGYGMALAQAQFKVVELAELLEERGVETMFAIHPVAGRMPGHMNVMLAEAEVDYDKLLEMDAANEKFPETDAVLIFGACDVVNPAAIRTEGTPISGMPILMAHEAGSVIVCNYDANPGYSGEENPLYEDKKSITLFGDALETAGKLIDGLRFPGAG
ncbi:MAG: NAD(P)(+) transhydrogenase (Re/Si-specific) subunit beta [Desulfobacteraceae bacterium]